MIGFTTGILYSNFLEWVIHRYFLHTKNKKSPFYFHWKHHNICRKNNNYDPEYDDPWYTENRIKEILSLVFVVFLHIPISFISPGFFVATIVFSVAYYFFHKKSHTDVAWGIKYMPWHYHHHMTGNQNYNWNIIFPLFDKIFKSYRE